MTKEDLIEQIKCRLAVVRVIAEEPEPEWWNPHDFSSGKYTGMKLALKEQIQWLEKRLILMEQDQ